MKILILLMSLTSFGAFSSNLGGKDCEVFLFTKYQEDSEVLTDIVTKHLGYDNLAAFLASDSYLSYQFNFMPNYFRSGEEFDDHYRLILNYEYEGVTLIYNATRKVMIEKRRYSTW